MGGLLVKKRARKSTGDGGPDQLLGPLRGQRLNEMRDKPKADAHAYEDD